MLTMDVMVDVDGRQADIAIRVADQPPEHLVGKRVAGLAGALYATRTYLKRHPQPLESKEHDWVDWDRRLAVKPAMSWMQLRFADRRIVARGLSTADVFHAVLADMGIGPLPCVMGDAEPSLVRLVDAPSDVWSSVWLLTHKELRRNARVRAVMDALGRAIRAARPAIEGETGRALPAGRARV